MAKVFEVGNKVKVKVGRGWLPGKIAALSNEDQIAAVELDRNGNTIYAAVSGLKRA
jgi:hypothetical protein